MQNSIEVVWWQVNVGDSIFSSPLGDLMLTVCLEKSARGGAGRGRNMRLQKGCKVPGTWGRDLRVILRILGAESRFWTEDRSLTCAWSRYQWSPSLKDAHQKNEDGEGLFPVRRQEHLCGSGRWQWLRVGNDEVELPQGSYRGPRQMSLKVVWDGELAVWADMGLWPGRGHRTATG